jgi:hypothetical protein
MRYSKDHILLILTFVVRWNSSRKEPSFEKTLIGLDCFELDFAEAGAGVEAGVALEG